MNNGTSLMPYQNICIKFEKQIIIEGVGLVWAAEYIDYSGEKIIIVPENSLFKPLLSSKYLVQRPKGFEEASAYYCKQPVYKKRILEIPLQRIAENDIYIYKSEFYVPKCTIRTNGLSVFLRPAKNKNHFALMWIEEENTRAKVFDHIKNNIPHSMLMMNKFDAITIEGSNGESIENLEKNIINSINCCLKG